MARGAEPEPASAAPPAASSDGAAGRRPDREVARVALFPLENLSGGSAPVRELRAALEVALARAGLEVVTGDTLEQFLSRHRIRYTGGLDLPTAQLAGTELGVSAVLLASLELFSTSPPKLGLTVRLVAAREGAAVLWIDGITRTGDEAPGLLGLGIIPSYPELQERVFGQLAARAAAALAAEGPRATACEESGRFRSKVRYRSPLLEPGQTYSVVVVPFRNQTVRRNAGDVVALEFLRQLAATPAFHVVEPGVVRDIILRNRVVMEGGISVDQVRTLLGALKADLVVAGDVFEFSEGPPPSVNFTTTILDGRTGEIVWQSTSHNTGNDGVWFFQQGSVHTAGTLACRMIRTTLDELFRTPAAPRIERKEEEPAGVPGPGDWRPSRRGKG